MTQSILNDRQVKEKERMEKEKEKTEKVASLIRVDAGARIVRAQPMTLSSVGVQKDRKEKEKEKEKERKEKEKEKEKGSKD